MKTTAPKPFVFVLMPLAKEFDDVYQLGIKPACEDSGAYAERIDEQLFDENILDRIYNQISKADLIVADMTGRNANVFYETGYAHALGKRVILITKEADDIPFDLKHYHHIIYENSISDLKKDLTKKVAWALTQPGAPLESSTIELFLNGIRLQDAREMWIPPSDRTCSIYGETDLQIDAYNSSKHDIKASKFNWGIIFRDDDDIFPGTYLFNREFFDCFKQPDKQTLFVFKRRAVLRPDSWKALKMTLSHKGRGFKDGDSLIAAMRLFFEYGTVGVPFRLVLHLSSA
jgi:nucleoside 2-deoxyribosyltransferase